jgi:sn-glycerol 3-phosphate transport system substrate-binding protein
VGVIPGVSGKDEKIPIGGASLVLFKGANSDIQKAAWDFIKYMSSSESSVYLSTHTGYLPIYTDAAASAEISTYLKEHPNRTVPMESLKYAVAIPEFSALGTSDSALRQAVQAVELQSATAQEALDKAKKTVDQSIKSQSTTN